MNKPARMLMLAGVVALLIGAFLALAGGPPEAAFATAMTATYANAAARAIRAANNSEIGGNALAMFLMGFGIVLLLVGFAKARKGQDRLS